jgi:hypothetical protein
MGWTCSAYGRDERRIQGFGEKTRERDHLEDPDVDGRVILRWTFRKWYVGQYASGSRSEKPGRF